MTDRKIERSNSGNGIASMPGSLGAFISDADSASLSAQHRISQRKLISEVRQNSVFMMLVTDLTETFLCLKAVSLFRRRWDQSFDIQMLP